jgi:hypothetical protein
MQRWFHENTARVPNVTIDESTLPSARSRVRAIGRDTILCA